MRLFLALLVGAVIVGFAVADDKPDLAKRYGIDADLKTYPQATPKEALASVLKAIENKKADYFAAHLADPEFVDRRLKETTSGFPQFVEEVTAKLVTDPGPLKQLQRFLKDGAWEITGDRAVVRVKDLADRCVYLRQIDNRWYLENRFQPEEKK